MNTELMSMLNHLIEADRMNTNPELDLATLAEELVKARIEADPEKRAAIEDSKAIMLAAMSKGKSVKAPPITAEFKKFKKDQEAKLQSSKVKCADQLKIYQIRKAKAEVSKRLELEALLKLTDLIHDL